MCILFARRFEPQEYPFKYVIAFNRDERVERPTRPLSEWRPDNAPFRLFSGLDEEHLGTWLAVSSDGRFAAVTNNREMPVKHGSNVSRGQLVLDYFNHSSPNDFATQTLEILANDIPNANFIFGDFLTGDFQCFGIHAGSTLRRSLDLRSPFVVANGSIDTEWPKVREGRALFNVAIAKSKSREELIDSLWDLLTNAELHDDNVPKNTILTSREEKRASGIFLRSVEISSVPEMNATYATLSSTIVLVDHSGKCSILEKTWRPTASFVEFSFVFNQER